MITSFTGNAFIAELSFESNSTVAFKRFPKECKIIFVTHSIKEEKESKK
jgi:hypothetical protein